MKAKLRQNFLYCLSTLGFGNICARYLLRILLECSAEKSRDSVERCSSTDVSGIRLESTSSWSVDSS